MTYGAGGSTRERTHATVKRILGETGADAGRASDLRRRDPRRNRRGDPRLSRRRRAPHRGAARRSDRRRRRAVRAASRRLQERRRSRRRHQAHRADIEVSVSAYPEKHPDSPTVEADIDMLKAKVDAGATPRDHPVLLRQRPLLPLSRPRARARHRRADRARHPAGAELQADEEFRRALRRLGAGLARRALRRPRRRRRDPQADRRRGRRRAGARPGRSRRHRFPLLHHEPRRSRLRDLPPARACGPQVPVAA